MVRFYYFKIQDYGKIVRKITKKKILTYVSNSSIQVINRIIVTICPLEIISSLSDNIVASFLAVKRTSRNFYPFSQNIIKKYYFFFQEVIKIFLNF